jgi:predicted GNAT family N-acyltransferase
LEVRAARSQVEVAEALELRERVFAGEQGVSVAADRDGRDAEALHVVAIEDGQLLGTCRLVFDAGVAKLGRMAVRADRRGEGIGDAVLREAERQARAAGARRVALHAQTYAKGLYARAGFEERGDEFFEEGIEHVAMEKRLA